MAVDSNDIEADVVLESRESNSCATLTPKMRGRIREMPVGGILEVKTADPSAREGVPSWCRLTGNELLSVVEDDPEITRFFIRKT